MTDKDALQKQANETVDSLAALVHMAPEVALPVIMMALVTLAEQLVEQDGGNLDMDIKLRDDNVPRRITLHKRGE